MNTVDHQFESHLFLYICNLCFDPQKTDNLTYNKKFLTVICRDRKGETSLWRTTELEDERQ